MFTEAALKDAQGMQMMWGRCGAGVKGMGPAAACLGLYRCVWGGSAMEHRYDDLPIRVPEGWPLHEQELVGA